MGTVLFEYETNLVEMYMYIDVVLCHCFVRCNKFFYFVLLA